MHLKSNPLQLHQSPATHHASVGAQWARIGFLSVKVSREQPAGWNCIQTFAHIYSSETKNTFWPASRSSSQSFVTLCPDAIVTLILSKRWYVATQIHKIYLWEHLFTGVKSSTQACCCTLVRQISQAETNPYSGSLWKMWTVWKLHLQARKPLGNLIS